MYTEKITNPKTGRQVNVRCWDVETKTAVALVNKDGVKALSWAMLDDDESIQTMSNEQHGDSASNNFALSVFENALDWGLGLKVTSYLQAYRSQHGRYPKSTKIACTRGGDVYVVLADGTLW
jgi:hypothetical protein